MAYPREPTAKPNQSTPEIKGQGRPSLSHCVTDDSTCGVPPYACQTQRSMRSTCVDDQMGCTSGHSAQCVANTAVPAVVQFPASFGKGINARSGRPSHSLHKDTQRRNAELGGSASTPLVDPRSPCRVDEAGDLILLVAQTPALGTTRLLSRPWFCRSHSADPVARTGGL